MKLTLKNVRLSFPKLFRPDDKFGGGPKYGASFIIDPESDEGMANLKGLEGIVRELEARHLGDKEMPEDRLPIKDGDIKGYPGWEGMRIVTANSRRPPVIHDRALREIAEGDAQEPYAGCYVDAVLDLYAIDPQSDYGPRICAALGGVRFRSKGKPFGKRLVDAENDYSAIADDNEADDVPEI